MNSHTPDTPAFIEGKRAVLKSLDKTMQLWNMDEMMEELRSSISLVKNTSSSVRTFARNHLGYSGQRYTRVMKWLKDPRCMTSDEVAHILSSLRTFRAEGRTIKVSQFGGSGQNYKREVGTHAVTLMNSVAGLIRSSGIKPGDISDGDRMQIQSAMRAVCVNTGITINFPKADDSRDQPVTRRDMANLGIPSKGNTR